MTQKIYKKSAAFWKHGKHGGMLGISCEINKESKPKRKFAEIDLTKSNWSTGK